MKEIRMRIALVAPLAEAVPPKLYGGTERVVSWLAEELVKLGHRVTLFASNGSETAGKLAVCAPQSLSLAGIRDHLGSTLAMLREVRRRADQFDIIHFHIDLLPQAMFHDLAHKCLVTLHGRLDLPDALPLYRAYPEMPLVSISDAQRRPMPPNEIDETQKCEFLGKARALLFPIDWAEPFGLVMIEAMSAGTPVIACRNGSVPEVITDGVKLDRRLR
jgi:glycosyltransferase involved in cell wall biosynthesis